MNKLVLFNTTPMTRAAMEARLRQSAILFFLRQLGSRTSMGNWVVVYNGQN